MRGEGRDRAEQQSGRSPAVADVAAWLSTTPTLTGFTDLVVHGTSGFDTISVTKSGTTYTFTHNGATQTASGNFQDLVIYAGGRRAA